MTAVSVTVELLEHCRVIVGDVDRRLASIEQSYWNEDVEDLTLDARCSVTTERDLAEAVLALAAERDELRRRALVVFEALDIDRSTVIAKRAVRSMLKGR